jgi:hypothetical protein
MSISARRHSSERMQPEHARAAVEPRNGDTSRRGALARDIANVALTNDGRIRGREQQPQQQHPEEGLFEGTSMRAVQGQVGFGGFAPAPARVQEQMAKFAAEPRDSAWASDTEGQLLSEISQSTVALIDWHVECRTSMCIVALQYPGATDPKALLGEPQRLSYAPNLLFGPSLLARDATGVALGGAQSLRTTSTSDALVYWLDLHRRCGSDWTCLKRD